MWNHQKLLPTDTDHGLSLKRSWRTWLLDLGLLGRSEGSPQSRVLRLLLLVVGDGDPGGVRVARLLRLLEVQRRGDGDEVTWEWRLHRRRAVIAVEVIVGIISHTGSNANTPEISLRMRTKKSHLDALTLDERDSDMRCRRGRGSR